MFEQPPMDRLEICKHSWVYHPVASIPLLDKCGIQAKYVQERTHCLHHNLGPNIQGLAWISCSVIWDRASVFSSFIKARSPFAPGCVKDVITRHALVDTNLYLSGEIYDFNHQVSSETYTCTYKSKTTYITYQIFI